MLLTMGGHERPALASQALALCVNVLICFFLIGDFGVIGVSIGISAGILLSTALNVLLVKRYFGFIPGIFLR
jgi:O-antigen/teichoic acid export membrane protein